MYNFRSIIQFEVEEVKEEEELKVSWKEVEAAVREAHSGLKIVYARGNGHKGQLAISTLRLKSELLEALVAGTLTIKEKSYKFTALKGEPLKEFWSNEGGHYNFCI